MSLPSFRLVGFDPDFVGYLEGWDLQKSVHRQVANGELPDTVLLLEHSAVYTAGKRTDVSELPFDGAEYVETDRGGKITWHGPGQLIGYPIMKLPQPIDVVGYVRYLERVIIDSLVEFDLLGKRVEGRTGVWVSVGGVDKKLAAIGIRVSEKVTMHGFAINCSNSLTPFDNIVACGLADASATSISELLGRSVTPLEFSKVIQRHLGEIPNARA